MRGLINTAESLIIGPTIEPLDLVETKKALRFAQTAEDTLIDVWISAARQHFEEQTGRQLISAIWEYWLDEAPLEQREIELPHPPLRDVVSVVYDDANGDEQTFDAANYRVIAPAGPLCTRGRIVLVAGAAWPIVQADRPKGLRIRFTAGYGATPGDVPELVRGALYFLVGHFHNNRSETHEGSRTAGLEQIPLGFATIVRGFKYSALPTLAPQSSFIGGLR